MKMSQLFVPTLFENPQEAEIISHKLMLRAGLIRKLSSGIYSYLPFGLRVLQKITTIVREEINSIGCQEVFLPAMQPASLWKETGRWEAYGDDMFKLKDRKGSDFGLAPTHEESITDLVRKEVHSYRQLPVSFYQIQTKFRDEPRPRFGMIRSREFLMKDAYSFHVNEESANSTYQAFYEAYIRIFNRCGLVFKIVEAEAGLIGGSFSHEFMATADSGEDITVECPVCNYAANLEAQKGDVCPRCQGVLKTSRGIELGHTFKLGTKYSEAMNTFVLDENGKERFVFMGCYGIGVSRLIPSIIEQNHDQKGIIWPVSIAPYTIIILPMNIYDKEVMKMAEDIYYFFQKQGVEVLLDNRDETPGKKFNDADLIGIPIQIIIGSKTKQTGKIEVCYRKTKEKEFVEYQQLNDILQVIPKFIEKNLGCGM